MTRPFFNKDRISHFDIFDRHASDALHQLKTRLREGYPVNIQVRPFGLLCVLCRDRHSITQDLASRFTMDSATEFLFGHDVHSLAAGLPYPHYSPLAESSENHDHPANKFSQAFDEAQRITSFRSRRGSSWPLQEFWTDKVKEHMVVVNSFITPILAAAVQKKRELGEQEKPAGDREVKDGESLLDHLINYTDGTSASVLGGS